MQKKERLRLTLLNKTVVLPANIIRKNYSMVSILLGMVFSFSGFILVLGQLNFGKIFLGILAGKVFVVTFLITCLLAAVLFLMIYYNTPIFSENVINTLLFIYINITIISFFLAFKNTFPSANNQDKARILIVFILYIYLASPILQLACFWKQMFPILYGMIFTVMGIAHFGMPPHVAFMMLLSAMAGAGIAHSIASSKNNIIKATKNKILLKAQLAEANSSISSLNNLKNEISTRLLALELEEMLVMITNLKKYGDMGEKFNLYQKYAQESMEKIVTYQNSIEGRIE